MLIKIEADGNNITVPFPTSLALNPATALVASKRGDVPFNAQQLSRFFRELKRSRKLLGDRPFVEVRDSDGDVVLIYL